MYIVIMIIIVLIVFLILNSAYKSTNHYKNKMNQLQKFMNDVPYDLEIVNTGSSYARYAFGYEKLSLKGFNFGLQPQSISYDFKILKQYTPNMKKECVVLISLPEFIFGFLDYKKDSSNTKYYYFLEPNNILSYSKTKHFLKTTLPILSDIKNVFRIIRDVPLTDLYNQDKNLMTEIEIQNDAISRVEDWKKQFGIKNTTDHCIPEVLEKMFYKTTNLVNEMIEYCINNNFRPVLIIPPNSGIINKLLSKEFMKTILYDNIEKANKKNVPVLDYLYNERFQNYDLYINSDMLNKVGREKFIQVVMNDLKDLGILSEV